MWKSIAGEKSQLVGLIFKQAALGAVLVLAWYHRADLALVVGAGLWTIGQMFSRHVSAELREK